jgi:hypothetical protein
VFFPSDGNIFFLYINQEDPNVTLSFWDYDAGGAPEEIGRASLSFLMLSESAESLPRHPISVPIIIDKPKTPHVRGFLEFRYGLVSRTPPHPAAELAKPGSSLQTSLFSQFLQRMVRFFQVAKIPSPKLQTKKLFFNLFSSTRILPATPPISLEI